MEGTEISTGESAKTLVSTEDISLTEDARLSLDFGWGSEPHIGNDVGRLVDPGDAIFRVFKDPEDPPTTNLLHEIRGLIKDPLPNGARVNPTVAVWVEIVLENPSDFDDWPTIRGSPLGKHLRNPDRSEDTAFIKWFAIHALTLRGPLPLDRGALKRYTIIVSSDQAISIQAPRPLITRHHPL